MKHHRAESAKGTGKQRAAAPELGSKISLQAGERRYKSIRATLERHHYGSYVMINTCTGEYVLGATTSQAHADFIENFGESAPGWCTRIGASVFATA